eukprot:12282070-Prorocentrum_lima.AAC.1
MSDRVEPIEVWRKVSECGWVWCSCWRGGVYRVGGSGRCGAGVDRWWGSAGHVPCLRWRTDEVVKVACLLMGVSGARFSEVEEAAA